MPRGPRDGHLGGRSECYLAGGRLLEGFLQRATSAPWPSCIRELAACGRPGWPGERKRGRERERARCRQLTVNVRQPVGRPTAWRRSKPEALVSGALGAKQQSSRAHWRPLARAQTSSSLLARSSASASSSSPFSLPCPPVRVCAPTKHWRRGREGGGGRRRRRPRFPAQRERERESRRRAYTELKCFNIIITRLSRGRTLLAARTLSPFGRGGLNLAEPRPWRLLGHLPARSNAGQVATFTWNSRSPQLVAVDAWRQLLYWTHWTQSAGERPATGTTMHASLLGAKLAALFLRRPSYSWAPDRLPSRDLAAAKF